MISMDTYSKALIEVATLQERERITDNLRDRAADLVADGDMASAELTLLSKLIDWLEGENNQTGKEFDYFETPFEGENK
jgi:hypothetical protein